jgi:hypothetical protein
MDIPNQPASLGQEFINIWSSVEIQIASKELI